MQAMAQRRSSCAHICSGDGLYYDVRCGHKGCCQSATMSFVAVVNVAVTVDRFSQNNFAAASVHHLLVIVVCKCAPDEHVRYAAR